jgi:hypothetical protein
MMQGMSQAPERPVTAKLVAGTGITLGLALILAGIVLGIVPVGEGCGSAFSREAFAGDLCRAATDSHKGIAFALIAPGLLIAIAAAGYLSRMQGATHEPMPAVFNGPS